MRTPALSDRTMLVASLHLRCRLCVHSPCLRAQAAAPEAAASSGATVAKKELSNMREALAGSSADHMRECAQFLKDLGIRSQADVARILDIATNPDSLFVTYQDRKRTFNANARPLTVENDLQPVTSFLRQQGLTDKQICDVVSGHPPVLCYSDTARLQPLFDFLESAGIDSVSSVIAKRPSLLGLEVEKNIKPIVSWLQDNEYSRQEIAHYLGTSI